MQRSSSVLSNLTSNPKRLIMYGGIGLAACAAIGGIYVYLKHRSQNQKEKIVENLVRFTRDPLALKSHTLFSIHSSIIKHLYETTNPSQKVFKFLDEDLQQQRQFHSRYITFYQYLFHVLFEESIHSKSIASSAHSYSDRLFDSAFDSILSVLRLLSTEQHLNQLKATTIKLLTMEIQSDINIELSDYKSNESHTRRRRGTEGIVSTQSTNLLELIIRHAQEMSFRTQEKFFMILSTLISFDSSFQTFVQIELAKNIYFITQIDFSCTLGESQQLGESIRTEEATANLYTTSSYRKNSNSRLTKSSAKLINKSNQTSISPLARFLINSPIPVAARAKIIELGYAERIIERMCEEVRRSNIELIERKGEKVVSNLACIMGKVLEEKSHCQSLLISSSESVLDNLVSALAFCETSETTGVNGTNIVILVNWMATNLEGVVSRIRCTSHISSVLRLLLTSNRANAFGAQLLGQKFIDSIRRINEIRRDDRLKGFEQLQVNLSLTSFLPHLLIQTMRDLPSQKGLMDSFANILPFFDQQECYFIAKSFTTLFSNFILMKELFVTMLEKTASQTNSMILAFNDLKHAFFSPEAHRYDEVLLGLQFSILLGGAECLCDQIVDKWQKDAEEYESFKIYLTSDLALLLQVLENDICYLNVSASTNWQDTLQSYASKALYREHAQLCVEKLIINYLQIFPHGIDKESLRESLRNQVVGTLLDSDEIFEAALDAVAQPAFDVIAGQPSLRLSQSLHHSHFSQLERYILQERYTDRYFHSLFNRDVHLLVRLMNQIQNNQNNSYQVHHDLHIESILNERDIPLRYISQVRRAILENIKLHTEFHFIFIQNETILLEKLRLICRILHYIYDVIEDGIMECRNTKKLTRDTLKSLLVLYVFDPILPEKIEYLTTELVDEDGELIAHQFIPTLNRISARRNHIMNLANLTLAEIPQF